MWQKYKELTGNIMALVRKNRVYAAQLELDKILVEMPDFAAELAVLSKLSKVGREPLPQSNQLLQESMEILDSSSETVKKQREDIDKLSQYLAKLQKSGKTDKIGESGLDNRQQLKSLASYLESIQGHKARRQLDVLGRTSDKLNILSKNLRSTQQPKPVVHPEVAKLKKLLESSNIVGVKQRA
jgi:hypothetical protein